MNIQEKSDGSVAIVSDNGEELIVVGKEEGFELRYHGAILEAKDGNIQVIKYVDDPEEEEVAEEPTEETPVEEAPPEE